MKHESCPITAQELIHEQPKDLYCSKASPTVRLTGSKFSYDRNGVLVRTARIEGEVQKIVPTSLQNCLLYRLQYPKLTGQLGELQMSDLMQR